MVLLFREKKTEHTTEVVRHNNRARGLSAAERPDKNFQNAKKAHPSRPLSALTRSGCQTSRGRGRSRRGYCAAAGPRRRAGWTPRARSAQRDEREGDARVGGCERDPRALGGREDAVWTHGARAAAHVRVDGVARELEVGEHVARADERRLPRLGHAHDLDHPRLRALHLGRLHLNGGAAWGGGVWEKRGWRRGVGVWGRARGARGEGWERGGRLPTPPPVGRALGPGARAGAAGLGR